MQQNAQSQAQSQALQSNYNNAFAQYQQRLDVLYGAQAVGRTLLVNWYEDSDYKAEVKAHVEPEDSKESEDIEVFDPVATRITRRLERSRRPSPHH